VNFLILSLLIKSIAGGTPRSGKQERTRTPMPREKLMRDLSKLVAMGRGGARSLKRNFRTHCSKVSLLVNFQTEFLPQHKERLFIFDS